MTGMRQTKSQYMGYIANGTLNYFSEKTEHMEITVNGDQAELVGQSRVSAAVFGGGKHVWSLQLSMKAVVSAIGLGCMTIGKNYSDKSRANSVFPVATGKIDDDCKE